MKLRPTETELIGRWEMADGRVRGDATCRRIEWLTSSYLEKIAASGGAWERSSETQMMAVTGNPTYPQGEMHGAGPPLLFALSVEKAHAKYGFA
jgi:Immunity protein 27